MNKKGKELKTKPGGFERKKRYFLPGFPWLAEGIPRRGRQLRKLSRICFLSSTTTTFSFVYNYGSGGGAWLFFF